MARGNKPGMIVRIVRIEGCVAVSAASVFSDQAVLYQSLACCFNLVPLRVTACLILLPDGFR